MHRKHGNVGAPTTGASRLRRVLLGRRGGRGQAGEVGHLRAPPRRGRRGGSQWRPPSALDRGTILHAPIGVLNPARPTPLSNEPALPLLLLPPAGPVPPPIRQDPPNGGSDVFGSCIFGNLQELSFISWNARACCIAHLTSMLPNAPFSKTVCGARGSFRFKGAMVIA